MQTDTLPEAAAPETNTRNQYGALTTSPDWLREILAGLNGTAWTTGLEGNKRGTRYQAVNTDVYSVDSTRHLAVVQVRQFTHRDGRFPRLRKDYYMIGRNENGNAFAHPIESPRRSPRARATPEAGVRRALAAIWQCEEHLIDAIRRNGDIAFVPDLLPPGAQPCDGNGLTLADSHVVRGEQLFRAPDGTYYVRGRATIVHVKRQHRAARVWEGTYRVQVGVRAHNWGFTAPTAD